MKKTWTKNIMHPCPLPLGLAAKKISFQNRGEGNIYRQKHQRDLVAGP